MANSLKTVFKNAQAKFMGFWDRPQDRDLSKQREYTIRPAQRKMTGGLAANEKLLKGINTGSAQEINLASYLSDGMVDKPKNFISVPGVIPDAGQDDRLVKELNQLIVDDYPILVETFLVQGTAWRWAVWSDKLHKLVWEAIPDSSISQIIIDLDTGEIDELWVTEQLEYNKGETNTAITTRKRHITRTMITEEWTGDKNKAVQYKNPFGFMPIPFGHKCYEGEWRGNSVFGRVLRWMKSIHNVAYKRDEILSEFDPKFVQTAKDVKAWIENNTPPGRGENVEYDPFAARLIVNQEGERTELLFLSSDATAQHTAAIKDDELKVIKGSGMPELFFGGLATGNHASTETDVLFAAKYVQSLQRELTKGTQELVNQSLKILAFMRFTQPPTVSVQWGNLSLLSHLQFSQVFGNYASAMVSLMNNAAITDKGALYFTKKLFPDYPAKDPEHFMQGINTMLTEHSSKVGQPAFDAGGLF